MNKVVTIYNGKYRGNVIHGEKFEVVKPITPGARGHFITVRPNENYNLGMDKIRITVNPEDVVYDEVSFDQSTDKETDEQVIERIAERFDIISEMTRAAVKGLVRSMIVVGPPGVGKSYGIERDLEAMNMFNDIVGRPPEYEIVKGAMSPIGLYSTLYNHRQKNRVLVFDDCDNILTDEVSLNLLKAALDSGGRRRLHWKADSHYLRNEEIPDEFDFEGAVIFITNIDFDAARSVKMREHLSALKSRSHYVDTSMKTIRDRLLRIKQIYQTGELFSKHDFQNGEGDLVVEFMENHLDELHEISLRMACKIADLVKISPHRWQRVAETTCLRAK